MPVDWKRGSGTLATTLPSKTPPFETGLGFAVDLKKSDFLGREALQAQRIEYQAATPDRMVMISVADLTENAGPYLSHDETLWKDDELVGYVTSAGWGYRLGAMIGLATLHRNGGVNTAWIESGGFSVQVAGQRFDAHVQLAPLYDPKGDKMRA